MPLEILAAISLPLDLTLSMRKLNWRTERDCAYLLVTVPPACFQTGSISEMDPSPYLMTLMRKEFQWWSPRLLSNTTKRTWMMMSSWQKWVFLNLPPWGIIASFSDRIPRSFGSGYLALLREGWELCLGRTCSSTPRLHVVRVSESSPLPPRLLSPYLWKPCALCFWTSLHCCPIWLSMC